MPHTSPTLIIHGGAWAMPDDAIAAHENGIANALAAGYAVLESGGTAVSAVEAAVVVMEDDDTFDAGRGSFLTRDGRVQLDALLMDGSNLRTGGVACVERLRNPIRAARLVLDESPHVYFVGAGAERFARQHGMELCENMDLVIPREQARLYAFQQAELAGGVDETFSGPASESALDKESAAALKSHDTVGAVALDIHGNIAAQAIAYLYKRLGGHGGIILLGPDGRIGLAHNTPRMAWGIQTPAGATLGVTRN
jgi:beta-aspartyl-peptidase (threonine type)